MLENNSGNPNIFYGIHLQFVIRIFIDKISGILVVWLKWNCNVEVCFVHFLFSMPWNIFFLSTQQPVFLCHVFAPFSFATQFKISFVFLSMNVLLLPHYSNVYSKNIFSLIHGIKNIPLRLFIPTIHMKICHFWECKIISDIQGDKTLNLHFMIFEESKNHSLLFANFKLLYWNSVRLSKSCWKTERIPGIYKIQFSWDGI